MSQLSYYPKGHMMEKLLDGVEVEWKTLGELVAINTGQKPSEILDSATRFDYINAGTSRSGYSASSNCDGDTVTTPSRGQGGIGYVGYQKDPFWLGPLCYKIKSLDNALLINKYIFYFFQSKSELLLGLKKEGGVPAVNKSDLARLEFPIPCPNNPEKSLAIQAEIVRILDAFTAMTAELTAELSMRKKQYNYYRDQLLSFEEGDVEWKTLGDVAVIGTGKHDTRDAIEDGDYIFYARGREPLKLNTFNFDETAIITAGDGAGVGKVYHYAQGKYALHQRAYRIVPDDSMHPRFVYHYISAYFNDYIQKASVSSSVTSLRRPMFLKFLIPVPPLSEQSRIVEILEKFDTLTTSLEEGLPREIKLRQKQYEYYRDLLLSFPKSHSDEAA